MDIGDFPQKLGLQQHEAAFRDNGIDFRVLPKLTAEDLKDLGVNMIGHRRLLRDAIAALRNPPAATVKAGADAPDVARLQRLADGASISAVAREMTASRATIMRVGRAGGGFRPDGVRMRERRLVTWAH